MVGNTILAIDLGKYKCVSCAYARVTAAAEYRTINRAAPSPNPQAGIFPHLQTLPRA